MVTTKDVLLGISDGDWVGFGLEDEINRVAVVGRLGTCRPAVLAWVFGEWLRVLSTGGVFVDTCGQVSALGVPGAGVMDVEGGALAKLVYGLDGFDDGLREEGVAGVLQTVRGGVGSWSVKAEQALELALRAGVVYNRRVGVGVPKVWARDCVDLLLNGPVGGQNGVMFEVLGGSGLAERLVAYWQMLADGWREVVGKCYALMGDGVESGIDPDDLKRPIRDGGSLVVNMSGGMSGNTGICGLGSMPTVLRSVETRGKRGLLGADLCSGLLAGGFGAGEFGDGPLLVGVWDWDRGVDLGKMDLVVDLEAVPREVADKCKRMGVDEGAVAAFEDSSALVIRRGSFACWMRPVDDSGSVSLG